MVFYWPALRFGVGLVGERLMRPAVGVWSSLGLYEFRCVVWVGRLGWALPLGSVSGGWVSNGPLWGMLWLLPRLARHMGWCGPSEGG